MLMGSCLHLAFFQAGVKKILAVVLALDLGHVDDSMLGHT
jgi:hypothetical protein